MKQLASDFSRRIDLDGVGPAPRPVDIDQSSTGFSRLVSLRIYSFVPGPPILGEAEGDEVAIAVLNGRCEIAVTGTRAGRFVLDAQEGARAIYLPPNHHYRLSPLGHVDVAYARARSTVESAPRSFAGAPLDVAGAFETLAFSLATLPNGKSVPLGDTQAERLVFVQSAKPVLIGEREQLASWDVLALQPGEAATATALADTLLYVVAA
jgi:hypothetical protein